MITAFLDTLDVSHDSGTVKSFDTIDASEEVVITAVRTTAKQHGLRATAIYLLFLRSCGAPAGRKGWRWLQELVEKHVRRQSR